MQSELISKSGRLNDRPTANANEREWVITCTDGTEFVSLYRSVQVSKWVPATQTVTNECGTFGSVKDAIGALVEKHKLYVR